MWGSKICQRLRALITCTPQPFVARRAASGRGVLNKTANSRASKLPQLCDPSQKCTTIFRCTQQAEETWRLSEEQEVCVDSVYSDGFWFGPITPGSRCYIPSAQAAPVSCCSSARVPVAHVGMQVFAHASRQREFRNFSLS